MLDWGASKIMQGLFRKPCLYSLVARVYLRPSLLEQHHPELILIGSGKGRKVVHVRNVVVHIDGQPFTLIE